MPYDAFISYSHGADLELAPAVRDGLQKLAKPWIGRRALNVFLDQASLELSSELGGSLDARIEDTRWLVLFMSEQSAQSRWVGAELAEWAAKKSKQQIALVLTSGEVVWDEQARDFDYQRSTAVSEGMRGIYTGQASEPLFLDLRWTKEIADGEKSLDLDHPRFRDAIATLAAPIHGIPKDELEGEDLRQFRLARRVRQVAMAVLLLLTAAAIIAGVKAVLERDRAEARRLAAVATVNADEQTDVALLLALQSLRTKDTPEGWQALFTALSQPVLARSPLAAASPDPAAPASPQSAVNRVVFSPDGSLLASMGNDGVVGAWDPAGERQIERLTGHEASLWEAAFSPDGTLLATPDSDYAVRLLAVDTSAWQRVPAGDALVDLDQPLVGHEGRVWDVAFAPHGKLLATASADGKVKLWDMENPRHPLVDTIDATVIGESPGSSAGDAEVWEVTFGDNGSRLLWVSDDGSLRSRPVTPGAAVEVLIDQRKEWSGGPTAPGVAFSHDGSMLAVANEDWTVQLWDLDSSPPSFVTLKGHDGFVVDLAFNSDDSRLASASQDRTVRIWNVATGEAVGRPLTGHDAGVGGVGFSPNGLLLASGGGDGSIRLWDLGAGSAVGRRLDHGRSALGVAVSSDGSRVASVGENSTVTMWDTATGRRLFDIPGCDMTKRHGPGALASVVFSRDDEQALLASTGEDGSVRLWDADTGCAVSEPLLGHGAPVEIAEFSPDGALLASWGIDDTVQIWDVASGEPVAPALEVSGTRSLAFNRDGSMLASTRWDGTVRLWELRRGTDRSWQVVQSGADLAGHDDMVLDAWFGSEGALLMSVSRDGLVLRWDLQTRTSAVVMKLDASEGNWTAAAFNDRGSVLAVAAADASVRRWDLESGRPAGLALPGHSKRVQRLAFSRDGTLLGSAGADGSVRLWPGQSRWKELACAAVGRDLSVAEWNRFVDAEQTPEKQCPRR